MKSVGFIKPSARPGSRAADELSALLPASVTILQKSLEVRSGTLSELVRALLAYEAKIAEFAEEGVDLVHPAGVPPLLVGYAGERELVERWEKRYRCAVFTNGMSQVGALRALGVKRLLGLGYFPGEINRSFAAYLSEAGFDVLDMVGMSVPFADVPSVPAAQVHAFIRAQVALQPRLQGLYLLGPAWQTLGLIEALEGELGAPVVHHVPAQSWEIQRRFGLHHPVEGHGRLMRELPRAAAPSAAVRPAAQPTSNLQSS